MRCRPTVARQHLSKLRFAGLLEGQRQGQRVVYRSRGGHVRALLTDALSSRSPRQRWPCIRLALRSPLTVMERCADRRTRTLKLGRSADRHDADRSPEVGPASPRPASYQAEGPRLTLERRGWLHANCAVISFLRRAGVTGIPVAPAGRLVVVRLLTILRSLGVHLLVGSASFRLDTFGHN